MVNLSLKIWLESIKEYPSLKKKHEELVLLSETSEKEKIEFQNRLLVIEKLLKEANAERDKHKNEQELKWHLTTKHTRADISYERIETDGAYKADVRSFFMPNYSYPHLKGKNHDETALNCLSWIMKNIKYIPDKKVYGYEEYWAMPYQVLKRREDDCDGGSVLLANLLLHNNVPFYRIRLNAGWVKNPTGSDKVGHAYVTYCRERDNQFVVLDWCFYQNSLPIEKRPLHKQQREYYNIWWSTDSKFTYINTDYDLPSLFKKNGG